MKLEMKDSNEIGCYLRSKRLESGLKIEEVIAIENSDSTICSHRYYQYVEAGRNIPSEEILKGLFRNLGVDYENWRKREKISNRIRFQNEFEQMVNKFMRRENEEGKKLYLLLKNESYYDETEPYYKQHLEYIEAMMEKGTKDVKQTLEKVAETIKISEPSMIDKKGNVDIAYLHNKRHCTVIEYRLLNAVARCYHQAGDVETAVDIMYDVVDMVESDVMEIHEKRRLMSYLSLNLSADLIDAERWEEAQEVLDKGIEWAKSEGIAVNLPYLLFNKGECLHHLGKKREANVCFREAYKTLLDLELFSEAERIKEVTRVEFEVCM